jgi:hypothetical protein
LTITRPEALAKEGRRRTKFGRRAAECVVCTVHYNTHGTTQYPIRRAQRLRRVLISAAVLPPNDSVCLHTHVRHCCRTNNNNNNNNKKMYYGITWTIAVLKYIIIVERLMVGNVSPFDCSCHATSLILIFWQSLPNTHWCIDYKRNVCRGWRTRLVTTFTDQPALNVLQ